MISVEFEITRQDYQAFLRLIYLRLQLWRRVAFFVTIIVVVQVFLLPHSDPFAIVISSLASLIVYVILLLLGLRYSSGAPSKAGSMLGYRTLNFTEAAIGYESDTSNGSYRWSAIIKIVETKSSFYLFVDKNMAILIPKRAFETEAEKARFEQLLRERTKAFAPYRIV